MKSCPACGEDIPADAVECSRCKAVLEGLEASDGVSASSFTPGERSPSEPPGDSGIAKPGEESLDDAETITPGEPSPSEPPGDSGIANPREESFDDAETVTPGERSRSEPLGDSGIAKPREESLDDAETVTPGERNRSEPPDNASTANPGEESLDDAETVAPGEVSLDRADTALPGEVKPLLGGRYELLEEIGRGGMGVVYKAHDTRLNNIVAIKLLSEKLEQDLIGIDSLKREARTAMKLSHPNIVKLHNYEEHPEGRFLVMEYVDGKSLAELLLEKERFSGDMVRKYGAAICRGLEHAHSEKVIHRDIKPSNVLIDEGGRIKITDFGIAHVLRDTHTRQTGKATSGTILYMSPEQIMGRRTGPRSDVYSLGITLYELLSGRPPFTSGDISMQHLRKRIEPIPDVDEQMNLILRKCCEKRPENRLQNARELRRALQGKYELEPVESEKPARERGRLSRRAKYAIALGVFLCLFLAGIMYLGSEVHEGIAPPAVLPAESETDFAIAELFPLHVGDTWTYRLGSGNFFFRTFYRENRTIAGTDVIDGRTYMRMETTDGAKWWWICDETGFWMGRISSGNRTFVTFNLTEPVIDSRIYAGYSKTTEFTNAVLSDSRGKELGILSGSFNFTVEQTNVPTQIGENTFYCVVATLSLAVDGLIGQTHKSWYASRIGHVENVTNSIYPPMVLESATVDGVTYDFLYQRRFVRILRDLGVRWDWMGLTIGRGGGVGADAESKVQSPKSKV